MHVFNITKCSRTYKGSGRTIYADTQFCAGGVEGEDSCVGDSGAGAYTEITENTVLKQQMQIGVVSWGPTKCGSSGVPGVYLKLRAYLPWILDNLREYTRYLVKYHYYFHYFTRYSDL